ncbi:Pep3/Vps18/deep orange family-domain-containing protein [Cristinia sonorae]|uniref:Pep3/Vps18/deep orange family-domain-containing protein n=1 Tax=Cristinia sonorae TaxID=1940300 RepID=A0A8K0USN8_9AGAR|nr:Pep3/Vps18/deep orange family-domain-containing protein [Cristinia sonorae]
MFDEYVEHTSAPNALSSTGLSLPHVQYEGFEPSPYVEDEVVFDGFGDRGDSNITSLPLFTLEKVQYPLSAPLASVAVASDTLILGLTNNIINIIELSGGETIQIPIPRKVLEMTIYKLFLDPSGRHLIVSSKQGENWYLFKGWKKPRLLKSFKMVIESIAWNKAALLGSPRSTSTREMLIGARNGTLYEAILDAEDDFFKSQERFLQPVFTLPERHPVTGVNFDFFPPVEAKRVLIMVTTPSRIYQFVGNSERRSETGTKTFASVFASYRDTAPRILELPGNIEQSELHIFTPNAEQAYSLPKGIAWMTAPGIYHGTLNFTSTSDDLIDGAQLLPYPPLPPSSPPSTVESGPPASMALTEFHFVLLYKDRVIGISCLNEELVYEELLPLKPQESIRGITSDPIRKTFWVYTDQSLYELSVANEDRDVWKILLAKGKHESALQYTKTASQRNIVISAQALAYFDEGRYFQAAQSYAQCSVTFEEVTLKFLDAGQRDALRTYLIARLERTKRTDVSQRMMLATWLVEFYLSNCNELDDLVASESASQDVVNLHAQRSIVEEELKQFFSTYKSILEPRTIYELIEGHGRTDMYLHFATVIEDFERVIEHYIMEEQWSKAIETLNSQNDLELYYRFASVLVYQAPKEMVDSWLRQPALDPLRLVPALLRLQHAPRDPLSPNQAIRYLNYVIFEQKSTSPIIHNLIITFHASTNSDDDGPLLRFLTSAPSNHMTDKPYYDLDYALRLCKQASRVQPCVHIYAKMGLWESSVDLALSKGDLDLAKVNANMPPEEDRQLRKRLWLKIAKYVVQEKQDIKTAMQFLENTDLLKVEDILPFFPDFVVIDDFKEEICTALEGYSAHIDALKADMDETTRNAQAIKQDIDALQKRFITLDVKEKCVVCELALLTRQFYVFPCHHTFHADCLIGLTKEYLPASSLRKIIALQTELVKNSPQTPVDRNAIANPQAAPLRQQAVQRNLLSANFGIPTTMQNGARAANSFGRNILSAGDRLRDLIVPDALASVVTAPAGWIPGIGGVGRRAGEKDTSKRAEMLRRELEDLLAGSCPLCESVIAGVDKPFIREGEEDTSWTL